MGSYNVVLNPQLWPSTCELFLTISLWAIYLKAGQLPQLPADSFYLSSSGGVVPGCPACLVHAFVHMCMHMPPCLTLPTLPPHPLPLALRSNLSPHACKAGTFWTAYHSGSVHPLSSHCWLPLFYTSVWMFNPSLIMTVTCLTSHQN